MIAEDHHYLQLHDFKVTGVLALQTAVALNGLEVFPQMVEYSQVQRVRPSILHIPGTVGSLFNLWHDLHGHVFTRSLQAAYHSHEQFIVIWQVWTKLTHSVEVLHRTCVILHFVSR